MFWYQLWKKVHRPLIVLSVVAFIVVTASHSEIRFHVEHQGDEHRNSNSNKNNVVDNNSNSDNGDSSSSIQIPLSSSFSDNDLLLRTTTLGGRGSQNSQELFSATEPSSSQDIIDDLLNSIPQIPVPPVQQLPYCNWKKTGSTNNKNHDGHLKSTGEEETGSSSSSTHSHPSHHENINNNNNFNNNSEEEDGQIVALGRQIVVATLDGKLSLLDQSGRILWTICTGQTFSSTISSLQLNENGKFIHLIPSLTGGLYKYDGDNLTPMPLNAETLLRKSFKLSNDVVMTGGKELRTFGVDLSSGHLRYECGLDGCSTPTKAESHREDDVVLVVKKQLQTVRAIDSSTGSERWNFSVATHELALAGVTEGCYEGEKKDSVQDPLVKMIIPEGIIMGADKGNDAVWQHKFASPISQAWILEDGKLKIIDPIKNSPLLDESPALYIGIHKQQFYVQESHTTAEKLENAFAISFYSKQDSQTKPLQIIWKPSTLIEGMHENKALAKYEPENRFPGFFIFEREEMTPSLPAIEAPPGSNQSGEEGEGQFDSSYFTTGDIPIIFVSLWYWWKEVIGISLLAAVLINVILMKQYSRVVRAQTIREVMGFLGNIAKKQQEERALLPRKESDTLDLPPSYRLRTRTTSSSSTASAGQNVGYVEEAPGLSFSSQYLREFVPIQCLGKGGFGVVFEARKRIDERHYAVKRIPLPNREKHREKVMREVKALAKLDHQNIVRYFNAWTENPPPGWLEKNDPLWSMCNFENSSANNYFSSFDTGPLSKNNTSIVQYRGGGGGKRDYSEISMPSKTPVDETVDDLEDSFIVFAAEGDSINNQDDNLNETGDFIPLRGGKKSRKYTSSSTTTQNWFDGGDNENEGEDSEDYKISSKNKKSPLLPITIRDSQNISLDGQSNDNSLVSSRRLGFFARPTSLDIPSSSMEDDYDDEEEEDEKPGQLKQALQLEDIDNEDVEEVGEEALNSIPPIMYLYIQQELCQKKTLQVWLRTTKTRKLQQVVEFFSQIVEAVEYIHSHKLIHRDLKPGNIFLSNGSSVENSNNIDSDCEFVTVKIGDFGLATTARLDVDTLTPANEHGPSKDQQAVSNLTGHVGTHLYMSPEQSQFKPYDFKVDIYSLGLIFFELLVPFSTEMERHEILSKVRKMEFPPSFVKDYSKEHLLIADMVSHDPKTRPNASEVKNWVKFHLRNLSPADDCTPIVNKKFDSHSKSHSAGSNLFPVKKCVNRLSYDDEKLLNRTQSCM